MDNLHNLPKELAEYDQWILWKLVERDGKATKVPCDRSGRPVPVNDPDSWLSLAEALDYFDGELPGPPVANGHPSGFGFCFTADDPFVGIDLDDCIPLRGHGREIAERLAGTYGEISPSGNGIKFVGIGELPEGYRNRTKDVEGFGQIEVYDRDRFFTITGNVFGLAFSVQPIQVELNYIADNWLKQEDPVTLPRTIEGASSLLERAHGFSGTDDELIEYLRIDPRYDMLWEGDTSDYGDDHSAADLALLEKLAWLCGPVPERIERIFDQSALAARSKWDRPDYRERSIAKALEGKTDFFSGSGHPMEAALDAEDLTPPAVEQGLAKLYADPAPPRAGNGLYSFPIPERGIIRDVVDLLGPLTESPDATLALGTLVMLSAVCGWGRTLKFGESPEPCILFAAIVGKSASGRKTTGMRSVEAIFREAFTEDELKLESVGHLSGRALVEIAMGGADIFYVKAKEPKVDQMIELEDGTVIQHPEWEEYDALKQAQDDKLANPPHIVILWDEMAKLFNVEGDWQSDTRTELLRMYNGTHGGIRTSGKNGLTVPKGKVQMAFLGTVVSDDVRRGLNSAQANDGFMGRIFFSPDSPDEKPALAFPPDEPPDYELRKLEIGRKLMKFKERCSTHESAFANWTADARACRQAWYEERKRGDGLPRILFDRAQATAAKIACLMALAEDSDVVTKQHVELGQQMADTSVQVSVEAVESAVEAQRDRYLDALEERITATGPVPMSVLMRDLGMLGAKEPGERMPERELRKHWIEKDPRFEFEEYRGGRRVKLLGTPA